ncbi:MAG: aldehyde dehydrogenase [Pseudomonadota bacterium]
MRRIVRLASTVVMATVLAWGLTPPRLLNAEEPLDPDEALLASLPEGPGKEEAFYACHGCHSFRLVSQQGLSRKHWDETLDWMVEEQGMPELEEDERALILDYLEAHYNETRVLN